MATQTAPRGTGTTLEGFEDTEVARLQQAEALIQRFEAKARKRRLQVQIARAKADIDAAAAALKTSLDEFERKFSTLQALRGATSTDTMNDKKESLS